jgi:(1->4)-alpha-D-glucan 1-alpha-D-glucosylmutase
VVGRRVLAIQLTCPGFADLYQGTPLRLASLVDPDNRGAPDWDAIATLMQRASSTEPGTSTRDGDDADFARAVLIRRLLGLRRRRAEAFGPDAGYEAVETIGEGSDHVLAFARTASGQPVSVTVAVRAIGRADAASGVSVVLPPGRWVSVIDERERSTAGGPCRLPDLVGTGGFDVLERHEPDQSSSM